MIEQAPQAPHVPSVDEKIAELIHIVKLKPMQESAYNANALYDMYVTDMESQFESEYGEKIKLDPPMLRALAANYLSPIGTRSVEQKHLFDVLCGKATNDETRDETKAYPQKQARHLLDILGEK